MLQNHLQVKFKQNQLHLKQSTNIENSQPQPTPSKVDNQMRYAANPKEPVNVSKEELKIILRN